jgi:hypothetical protein
MCAARPGHRWTSGFQPHAAPLHAQHYGNGSIVEASRPTQRPLLQRCGYGVRRVHPRLYDAADWAQPFPEPILAKLSTHTSNR